MTPLPTDAFETLLASRNSDWLSPAITRAAELCQQASEATDDTERASLLNQAIGYNRVSTEAYLLYSELLQRHNLLAQAALCLEEANRLTGLDENRTAALNRLRAAPEVHDNPLYQTFRERAFPDFGHAEKPLKILVITNLLPPQEMGGFGRTVWEFGETFLKRGHDVKLLSADLPHLMKDVDRGHRHMERFIDRALRLYGDWKNGQCVAETDVSKIQTTINHNRGIVRRAITDFRPDVCMVGNLDFLGVAYLGDLVAHRIPIVHRLGNESPGFPVASTPTTGTYVLAGCSRWLNQKIQEQGYPIDHYEVVYPASPIEEYYKAFPPDFSGLRICFASLLMPYKGCQVLVEALRLLHGKGIPFSCEIAGDPVDLPFARSLAEKVIHAGFGEKVRFLGFLNKTELRDLYARSNVLVFPSVFDEPFGKSQIEAMAAGLIPVTSGTGGAREIVTHGKDGFHFRSGNAASLASVLEGIAKLPSETAVMLSKRAVQRSANFGNKQSVTKLEAIFEKALTHRYPSRSRTVKPPKPEERGVHTLGTRQLAAIQQEIDDVKSLALLPGLHRKLYMPWTSSAIRASSLRLVLNEISIQQKRMIVELGSGISTLFIADLARTLGFDFYSIDDNARWQTLVRRQLRQLEIPDETVTFVEAPLGPSSLANHGLAWYSEDQLVRVFETAPPIDMMLVDGPIAAMQGCEHARYPAVPFFHKFLDKNCSIFLDDCNRKGEKEILSAWATDYEFKARICTDFGHIGVLWKETSKRFNIF